MWTEIANPPTIAEQRAIFQELVTALHERETAAGFSLTTFPALEGNMQGEGGEVIAKIRARIPQILGSRDALGLFKGFVSPDFTDYENVDAVLDAAGHTAWIAKPNVGDPAVIHQLRDVLGVLVHYGNWVDRDSVSLTSWTRGPSNFSPSVAWTNLFDSPGSGDPPPSILTGEIGISFGGFDPYYAYRQAARLTYESASGLGTQAAIVVQMYAHYISQAGAFSSDALSQDITIYVEGVPFTFLTGQTYTTSQKEPYYTFLISSEREPYYIDIVPDTGARTPHFHTGTGGGKVNIGSLGAFLFHELSVGDGLTYG